MHTIQVDGVCTVWLNRPAVRNAVDRATAAALYDAFTAFDADPDAHVAVLATTGSHFCAGADLKAIAQGEGNRITPDGPGPMGPTRMRLSKPVIAAIEGYAVAGGLELALWADLRVAAENATFGVFCRRVGVPLIDGGTVRLPRLVGESRAMEWTLTGRPVPATEAHAAGLVHRLCAPGEAQKVAATWAAELASLPQACLRVDREGIRRAHADDEATLLSEEFARGRTVLEESRRYAERFAKGEGRGGKPL